MTLVYEGGTQADLARPQRDRRTVWGVAHRTLPLVLGLAVWLYGLTQVHITNLGTDGLVSAAGPWLFIGAGLIVAGFALEMSGKAAGWLMALHLVALVVVVQATVPILTHTPEYAWVYKHIGVAESFRINGRVTSSYDIYQQWPAFFALLAGVTSAAHTSALQVALWAPLGFELLNCLLLVAIFRTLTTSKTVPYLAAFLFEALTSWVGQDYLSPQAFAFVLSLAIVLVVLKWLVPGEVSVARWFPLRGVQAYLTKGFNCRSIGVPSSRRLAVIAVTLMFAVIVMAHQLTPIIVLAGIAGLTIAGIVRPRWLIVMLGVIAVGFILSRYHLISSEYGGLFSGGDVVSNASGSVRTWHSASQALSAELVRGLAALMWVSTVCIIVRWWRNLGRVIIPAVLAFAPFSVLFGQSYGGEAIYRVFLFSAPWCAFLIASTLCRIRWSAWRMALVAVVPAIVLIASLQALWGPAAVNTFTPSELQASEYFYQHAPAASALILADQNFPALETANYDSYELQVLPSDPQSGLSWLNAGNIPEVDSWVKSIGRSESYLVISRSMIDYAQYYGFPKGFEHLRSELPSSKHWSVWYSNADVTIYRFNG
jgi:hypothetical protein